MTSAMTSTRGMRRVEVRDSKLRSVRVRERKPRCVVARGVRDQWNRTFERCVGACVVSNGIEGSTSV